MNKLFMPTLTQYKAYNMTLNNQDHHKKTKEEYIDNLATQLKVWSTEIDV